MKPVDADSYKEDFQTARKQYIAALRYNRALDFYTAMPDLWNAIASSGWSSSYRQGYHIRVRNDAFDFDANLSSRSGGWYVSMNLRYHRVHDDLRKIAPGEWGNYFYRVEVKAEYDRPAMEKGLEFIEKKLTHLKTARLKEIEKLSLEF